MTGQMAAAGLPQNNEGGKPILRIGGQLCGGGSQRHRNFTVFVAKKFLAAPFCR